MRGTQQLLAFNRGVVSPLALARLDLSKLQMAAVEQTNWMPRALGSMMLRPGSTYIGTALGVSKGIPFVYASDDVARLEVTGTSIRVWVDDAAVTRPAVTAAVTNGTFGTDLAGWTDADEGVATSVWATGGYMSLLGTGTSAAIRRQTLTINEVGTEHALRIVVSRGPVMLRVGSSSGGEQYIAEASLATGTHSLSFSPSGVSAYIQIYSRLTYTVLVDSVAVESAGAMTLPSPWAEADLDLLRWRQSGDVLYVACGGYQQRKIERRSATSWSIVKDQPIDGPFRVQNITPITIAVSALTNETTLTASAGIFKSTNVGSLYQIVSVGQVVNKVATAENTFSDPIEVTGVGESRRIGVNVEDTVPGTATVTLQRSLDDGSTWSDIESYTTIVGTTYLDDLDNQIVKYRLGIKTGAYTSGTWGMSLTYSGGSITGTVLVTSYSSETSVSGVVLSALGNTTATENWSEGQWSDRRGWPSAVEFHDGRLFWAGNDKFNGSVTDAFESFDPDYEGDAAPISRSVGFGPVETINWMLSLSRLTAGTYGNEVQIKSSALDEPLTPTNFTPRKAGGQGSLAIQAVDLDATGVFVQRCGKRLFEIGPSSQAAEFGVSDLTMMCPDLCAAGIVGIAVQRQPDTRIHAWLADGTVVILILDRSENLLCFVTYETDGDVEDVVVLPGTTEDAVYYTVKRTINGSDVRMFERWCLESEARGGTTNKMADCGIYYSGASTSIIPGLSHLEGEEVIVWGGGVDMSAGDDDDQTTYTVTSGAVTLPSAVTTAFVGLPYAARFKGTKLAYVAQPGRSAIGATKRIDEISVVLADTHAQGLRYGQDFDTMWGMPLVEDGTTIDTTAVNAEFEGGPTPFDGTWTTDARLCLKAQAPRPCTVLGVVLNMTSNS